jgi:hypothetical protein
MATEEQVKQAPIRVSTWSAGLKKRLVGRGAFGAREVGRDVERQFTLPQPPGPFSVTGCPSLPEPSSRTHGGAPDHRNIAALRYTLRSRSVG